MDKEKCMFPDCDEKATKTRTFTMEKFCEEHYEIITPSKGAPSGVEDLINKINNMEEYKVLIRSDGEIAGVVYEINSVTHKKYGIERKIAKYWNMNGEPQEEPLDVIDLRHKKAISVTPMVNNNTIITNLTEDLELRHWEG